MARKPRRSPRRAPKSDDPYDPYSTWDIRIARTFFWAMIFNIVIVILGIWWTIVAILADAGLLAVIAGWDFSAIVLLIVGIVILHLGIAVLFYVLFRGGKLKVLKLLFKDRIVAKKYEDFQSLRILLAFILISIYIFVLALVIFIIPGSFFQEFGPVFWTWFLHNLLLGIGIFIFIILLISFIGFVLWNHWVYWVLRKLKRIEEEREIKEIIEIEKLEKADDETLYQAYHKETGKNAIYRNKETKGYLEWKEKKGL